MNEQITIPMKQYLQLLDDSIQLNEMNPSYEKLKVSLRQILEWIKITVPDNFEKKDLHTLTYGELISVTSQDSDVGKWIKDLVVELLILKEG